MPKYEFRYPSVDASEEKMLDDVLAVLVQNGVDKDLQDGFLLAVSEAFTNALIHGNQLKPDRTIKVLVDINNETLLADIIDEGQGGLDKIKHRRPPTLFSEGGRGVDLMKYYASDVKFTETEMGGLRVSIRFDAKKKSRRKFHIVECGGYHGNHR
ncbi:MAG: ATP-binding protein [Candidatus Zixiibacteriota bacterium]